MRGPTAQASLAGRWSSFQWMSNRGIVKLNSILLLTLVSSYACGYDTSMMNGLQALDTWKASFNHPGAAELGL